MNKARGCGRLLIWALLALPSLGGCARDFAAPPPEVRIDSFEPAAGFMGDQVVLCGRNFAVPAENNTVSFGLNLAEVVADDDPDLNADCALERLAVRVPWLTSDAAVQVKVQNQTSQAAAEGAFRYLGPGHPANDRRGDVMPMRFMPSATSGLSLDLGGDRLEWLATADTEARMLSLFDMGEGSHLDFGVCHKPISVAMTLADVQPNDGPRIEVRASAVVVEVEDNDSLEVNTRLWSIAATFEEGRALPTFSTPDTAFNLPSLHDDQLGADRPLKPNRIWPVCRDDTCILQDAVLSDGSAPVLAWLPGEAELPIWLKAVPANGSVCGPLGRVVDLIEHQDELGRALLAVFDRGAEIWAMPTDQAGTPERVWPPDAAGLACQSTLGAIAERSLSTTHASARIYAAGQTAGTIWEFRYGQTTPRSLELTGRVIQLGAQPLAIQTGRYWRADDQGNAVAGERLYAVTTDGILFVDISEVPDLISVGPMPPAGFIPLPNNRATPQSLSLLARFDPADEGSRADHLVYADLGQDQMIHFDAGNEQATFAAFPIATFTPQVAPSTLADALYLADGAANVVRLLDRATGAQIFQFPLDGAVGFGTIDLTSARIEGLELVVAPLAATEMLASRATFDRIAYAGLSALGDLPPCAYDQLGLGAQSMFGQPFHELHLVTDPDNPDGFWLELIQYGHEAREGWIKVFKLDMGRIVDQQMIPSEPFYSLPLPPEVQLQRVSPRHKITTLVILADTVLLQIVDPLLPEREEDPLVALDRDVAPFFTDALTARAGPKGAPTYLVATALSSLGKVLITQVVPEQPDLFRPHALIDTGGMPTGLFLSPDERRLYATHISEGLVSVIDLDCAPLPACLQVVRTLGVDDYPAEIQFDRSGERGYLTHLFNNVVTLIE